MREGRRPPGEESYGSASQAESRRVVGLIALAVLMCFIDRASISVAIIPMAEEFAWSQATQGLVLASFFAGYVLLQIAGGRLADRFGGELVLGAGVVAWSLFTVLTPPAAALGLGFLLMARVGLGLGEAVTFPSIHNIYARRIPLQARARVMGFTSSAAPAGVVLALVVTPIVARTLGWQWAFYAFGAAGFCWYAWWHRAVVRRPDERLVQTPARVNPVALEEPGSGTAPWRAFLTGRPVWALIVCHFCNNWSLYVLLSLFPKFMTEEFGVDYSVVGWFSMVPHLATVVFLNVAGHVADRLVRAGMEVGTVRKFMQTVALGGIAAALLIVGTVESPWTAIAVMTAGNAIGTFGVGGLAVNHMDIAPRHAGTLLGITNTAGTIPGIVGVLVSSWILELTSSWALVFGVAAGVSLVGMLVFLLFSSGRKLFD